MVEETIRRVMKEDIMVGGQKNCAFRSIVGIANMVVSANLIIAVVSVESMDAENTIAGKP